MAEHPNVDLLRKGYDAFARADMDALSSLFAEDVTWHNLGVGPMNGDRNGQQEVFEFFGWLAQESGGTLRVELHDLLANDEHGVALVEISAERRGRTLKQKATQIFHVTDGRVTEFWAFNEDPAQSDEFWS